VTRSAGGGTSVVRYPNRYDLSVNNARVENAAASVASMITGTATAAAGSYIGGGTGNKALLGCKGHDGLLLSALQSLEWSWELVGFQDPNPRFYAPYLNMQVQLTTGEYKILVVDPNVTGLNLGTLTSLGANKFRFRHDTSVNFVSVGDAFSARPANPALGLVDMPLVCDPVNPPSAPGTTPNPVAYAAGPPPPVVPAPIIPGTWPGYSFRYTDILAVPGWSGAKLVDVFIGDNGLPGPAPTIGSPGGLITPAVLLSLGNSGFHDQRNLRVSSILLNGAPALGRYDRRSGVIASAGWNTRTTIWLVTSTTTSCARTIPCT
jgi:hypothetical protein